MFGIKNKKVPGGKGKSDITMYGDIYFNQVFDVFELDIMKFYFLNLRKLC